MKMLVACYYHNYYSITDVDIKYDWTPLAYQSIITFLWLVNPNMQSQASQKAMQSL
jgi:hypothetical protein